MNKQVAT